MKTAFVSLVLVLLCLAACSKDSGGGLSDIPPVATLVNQATPTALKSSSRAMFVEDLRSDQATIKTNLQAMFKGSYGKLSGGNGVGFINAFLEDMDSRFTEIKSRFSSSAPACFSKTAQTYAVDLSALVPSLASTLKLEMDVQCLDLFDTSKSGEQSGSGSGLLFGKSGSNYSLMLVLNSKTSAGDGFGYAAKVTNKGATDETVDLMFVEASGTAHSRTTLMRVKAKPNTNAYEMVAASNSPGGMSPISGTAATLGCNVHMISDGTNVSVAGNFHAADCSTATAFDWCYLASDLSNLTTECNTLKTQYTIGAAADLDDLTNTSVNGQNTALFNAIQINTDTVKAKATLTSAK